MGKFDYGDGPMEENSLGSVKAYKEERCRPDFETMIEREKTKQELLGKLHSVLVDCLFGDVRLGFNESALKDLLGSVAVRLLASEKAINTLMTEQENYQE
jgi:hypothetical protein